MGETRVAVCDGGKEARGVSGTWSMVDAIGESKLRLSSALTSVSGVDKK
jgi:hypothetical protein